jgi:uncharacterized protein YoxC
MLENLKEVILNLEKSLNMIVEDNDVELLKHPEYLEAMKEVVQSINQVTQTLKRLEESYGQEEEPEKNTEKAGRLDPANRILKVVKKKPEDRRASSN